MSVRALAKRLRTDPATMVRIVRGMKFDSYREFQHYVHELSIAHATSLDTMQTGPAGEVRHLDASACVARSGRQEPEPSRPDPGTAADRGAGAAALCRAARGAASAAIWPPTW